MLPEKRKQCTRFLRLAAQGDVDAARTSTLWNSLPTHLHEEATRSMLGRAGLTSKELSMILHCEGAKLIKNVMTYAGSDDCPFCHQGRESRFHWRHECTQSENGFLQLYQAVSKDLATAGPEFWFDLLRRVDPASGSAARPPSWWANSGVRTELPYSTSLTWDLETPGNHNHRSSITATQGRVLAHLWVGLQLFASQTYHVLLQAIQGGALTDSPFDVALACPPEIKKWVQDAFLIEGECLTTALTVTSIFAQPPGVI